MSAPTTRTILSTILSTRTSMLPFLRSSARTAIKVDVNRHCVDEALSGNTTGSTLTQGPVELPTDKLSRPDLEALKGASSVVFSWPDSTDASPSNVLNTLEGALREADQEVTTTRPFFMLDGGGRRMATLSLLGNQDHRMVIGDVDHELPGTWLRHFASQRTVNDST
mmetsp:Transcript_930/g.1466  ORF Transcript_930/g.1466 Transcript_930/m.1466 type:complete len:167 (+) Transcript_930:63-563(+)|eukprot:CAMPEP_0178763500 /NCGR_PEP_ID=MMETSP0744-20121128/17204_1 /TAXON_ID=913974 /ORGANISM="Nitzschia punctata, Strain CCMP561" /LENGTH=166 /DNA_ID=CAMNT_0020418439 /DNA_START=58 /DNA_END=558 /DNA_ORIENTATION=-